MLSDRMAIDSKIALPFTELNPEKSPTILLIHGGGSKSTEFDGAVKYLPDYHLLIPDLSTLR